MSRFRDDAPPWSFFIPVTLAVVIGVLAADAIRYAISTVFGRDAPSQQAAERAPDPRLRETAEETAEPAAATTEPGTVPQPIAPAPVPAPVEEDAAAIEDAEATVGEETVPVTSGNGELELPGPITARRDNDPAACVNGTVANRIPRGWEQALEDNAPVRCVATSP